MQLGVTKNKETQEKMYSVRANLTCLAPICATLSLVASHMHAMAQVSGSRQPCEETQSMKTRCTALAEGCAPVEKPGKPKIRNCFEMLMQTLVIAATIHRTGDCVASGALSAARKTKNWHLLRNAVCVGTEMHFTRANITCFML